MNHAELFNLYKRVQAKEHAAEDLLIAEHAKKYPRNYLNKTHRSKSSEYRWELHTMYLHLTR